MRGQSTTESTLQLTADVDGVIDDSVCSFLPRRDTNDVIICGFLGSLSPGSFGSMVRWVFNITLLLHCLLSTEHK